MAIGDYTVIADVGLSLIKLLREHMTPEPIPHPELIGIASPADKGDLSLSLYLYNIKENGDARKTQMQSKGTGSLQFPPMTVDLYFLMTAHSNADLMSRTVDEHRIFGRAMQVLYDHSILRSPYLQGTLAERNEEVRISMENYSPDAITGMWNFADVPYKLSVCYRIGPVNLESNRIKAVTRVVEKDIRIYERGDS